MPCYNEEQRLPRTIEQIERYLDTKETPYELILVDDGSADGTRLIMDAAAERHGACGRAAAHSGRSMRWLASAWERWSWSSSSR